MTKGVNAERANVAFAGLTAAGKTTHAKILAEQLGFNYVSATQTILDIIGMDEDPDRVWLDKYVEVEQAREGDKIDIELESRMSKLADTHSGLILDTWAMAWIYNGSTPMVRLWIDSDEDSRTRKCYISQRINKHRDLTDCRILIDQKDNDTRIKFKRRLNFDLFTDRSKYDIILSNTHLIPEATETSAKIGIATFAPIVLMAAKYCINKISDLAYDKDSNIAYGLIKDSNGMITKLGDVQTSL